MDYIHLLITFIILALVAMALTYFGGLGGGVIGCILLSLHNVWVSNLIRSQRLKAGIIIFIQNMIVFIPIMMCLDQIFIFVRTGEVNVVQLVSYLILSPIIVMVFFNWKKIVNFKLSEYIAHKKEIRAYNKQKSQEKRDKYKQKVEFEKLESAYTKAELDSTNLQKYFSTSAKIVCTSKFSKSYRQAMAFYASKLILKGLETNNSELALKVFNHYIEKIFPYTGSDQYQSNIIGNSLGLAIMYNLKEVGDKVFEVLLPVNFNIRDIENNLILYNLACWYSVNKEKQNMLVAIQQGIKHGKQADQYTQDPDFAEYHNDADFLEAIRSK